VRVIGYTRVSTDGQDLGLAAQRDAILERYPQAELVEEHGSGGKVNPQLREALAGLRRGDTLVALRLDRVTRSLLDFANLVTRARTRGWSIVIIEQGFDLGTPEGKAFAGMLAVFAEFERDLISARIKEALVHVKDPRRIPPERKTAILKAHRRGWSQRRIAGELDENRRSVARVVQSAA
jgi:DNA invertase Pin-like site-specific DNA recombinase